MIAIVNVSKRRSGWNTYQVKINHHVVAEFSHKYEDGLAVLLAKAHERVAELSVYKRKL